MRVIHVASELAPIAKVGGIGDVILGLCRSCIEIGIEIEVVLPLYSKIDLGLLLDLQKEQTLSFLYGKDQITCNVFRATHAGIPLVLLDIDGRSNPFRRENIYGENDDVFRFSLFNLAAAKYLEEQLFSILHLHDWMTAAIPYLIKKNAPNVLSLHNMAYMGMTSKEDLLAMQLPLEPFEFNNNYSLLKGGIEIADSLVAVSPTYAQEILAPAFGNELSKTLLENKEKLCGILNGIDYDYWNPSVDPHLNHNFSKDHLGNKTLLKQELYDSLSLINPDKPLVSAVARLVPQKGPELIFAGFEKALDNGCSCVFLAASQDKEARAPFEALKEKYPHQLHLEFTFNEPLSHLVFAASDLSLVPSHFEPCGLTQMIAMRYGTIPIVNPTGGLKDTVTSETGFLMKKPTPEEIKNSLIKAFSLWDHDPQTWHRMQRACMNQDFSWHHPAEEYKTLYQKLITTYKASIS
jgi:starch synthase